MQFQNRPTPEEHSTPNTLSHHLTSCSQFRFCHQQFHFVLIRMHHYSFTDLQFHCLSERMLEWMSFSGWRLFSFSFSLCVFFRPFVFRSTIFLQQHQFHSLVYVCSGFSLSLCDKCVNCTSQHFMPFFLRLVWFLLPFMWFTFKWVNFPNSKLLCTQQHYTSYIQALSLVMFVSCVSLCLCASVHPKCYQLQPHFMNGFRVLCFFFTTEIFMFPQFYMFVAVFFKLLFT